MQTLIFDNYFEAIKNGIPPISCAIFRPNLHYDLIDLNLNSIYEMIRLLPLDPKGSIWIKAQDFRNSNDSVLRVSDLIANKFKHLFLADQITCFTTNNKRNKPYLISPYFWLRYTKIIPKDCYFDSDKLLSHSSVWSIPQKECIDWYSKQIVLTCPEDGFVLDAMYYNEFVMTAAERENRNFVGTNLH